MLVLITLPVSCPTGASNILLNTCPSSLLLTCPYHFIIFLVILFGATFIDPLTCSFLILSFLVPPHIHCSILTHSPPVSFLGFSLLTMSLYIYAYSFKGVFLPHNTALLPISPCYTHLVSYLHIHKNKYINKRLFQVIHPLWTANVIRRKREIGSLLRYHPITIQLRLLLGAD